MAIRGGGEIMDKLYLIHSVYPSKGEVKELRIIDSNPTYYVVEEDCLPVIVNKSDLNKLQARKTPLNSPRIITDKLQVGIEKWNNFQGEECKHYLRMAEMSKNRKIDIKNL